MSNLVIINFAIYDLVIVKSLPLSCPLSVVRVVGGLGCGWAKLNVLQKRWLVCRLAALLILRRVGNLSVILLFVCCRSCRLLG